ncbi:hypothetical protein CABS01_13075 [Colletotrichum abscissum]|uniref:Uncharacterized protein n=3 Tax=Colletotrichum acutatum species complex TaxID=2707335 RepID=A0AAI9YSQ8_9PEZI|nr:hypothetical protein CMEL01_10018 [Colletotrichum melonis]KAK1486942.1 hypothetical protein CABS01_13075 [Colletotrichum abscissum]KAK1489443.1 hypothetical protein CCUS01_03491 [Colletotrichum cuscutae]KAK1522329.1 hypothetical protein CCOS01_10041 [Colletotrichum costaricense]
MFVTPTNLILISNATSIHTTRLYP